jgi:hypothetical protein
LDCHRHEQDKAYNSVILHVVESIDAAEVLGFLLMAKKGEPEYMEKALTLLESIGGGTKLY